MAQNQKIRITILQYHVAWEDKNTNLAYIDRNVSTLYGKTDLVVLPEMCTTGFTYNIQDLAESVEGHTIRELKHIAQKYNIALCGSFLCKQDEDIFNRGFFIYPNGELYYDKRHLFRMGREGELFSAGNSRIIISYKGYNICPLICYDLRFPVWSRNIDNEYDILVYIGNWPVARKNVWKTLLKARAIENMSYVVGVNRIGIDGNNISYTGSSMVVDQRGYIKERLSDTEEEAITVTIDKEELVKDRENFPIWKDADNFRITI